MAKTPTPEGRVKTAVFDWLKASGYWYERMQSGLVKCKGGGWMHLCETGTPDVIVFTKSGMVVWLELKAPKGKQSPEQIRFESIAAAHGHVHLVIRSVDELKEYFKGAA